MLVLILFSLIAGVVTVLSPCILPLLPIILSSSVGNREDTKKPYGVITGFILSFTIFTLFFASIVSLTGISADVLRTAAIVVIGLFGISLISPQIQAKIETLFSKFTKYAPQTQGKQGFGGGFLIGLSLGLLWTPCVGPILASVISLAVIGEVSFAAFLITLSYAAGTAIPMLLIMKGGATALKKTSWLAQNSAKIQKAFGILMILTAVLIAFDLDRKFQIILLDAFPNYGAGLTKIEDTEIVKNQLKKFGGDGPMNDNKKIQDMFYGMKVPAKELIPGGEWINSEPLTLEKLKGKVVLIDFWTYSCINCQRTLPYLRDWWKKYEDKGLVIIGVHSPEFEFEKNYNNVLGAVEDFGLKYPVMQDNDFKTWRAYSNRYWPAKYLIDKDGYVRYTHFGEGEYDETEEAIQFLLNEAGADAKEEIDNPKYQTYSRTPETYLGYLRMSGFASPEPVKRDEFQVYTSPDPKDLPENRFSYEGNWNISGEYSNAKSGGNLYLRFNSKAVYLVMNPKDGESAVNVYLDGELVKRVNVSSDSLYTLVEMENPGKHLLRLEFLDDDTEIYAFTFG